MTDHDPTAHDEPIMHKPPITPPVDTNRTHRHTNTPVPHGTAGDYPILTAENLSFRYPQSDWQLTDINLAITPGTMTAIIGPNGAGKSTCLRLLAGILTPTTGSITLNNTPLPNLPRKQLARTLAYLPQTASPPFNYTVEEIVAMGRYAHTGGMMLLNRRDLDIINHSLQLTDMASFRQRHFSQLSGGQQRRVLLAATFAQTPTLLLLDEPTAGLDPHHQTALFQLLKQQASQGLTVITVTHDINLAALFCDRLLVLHQGTPLTCDTPAQVLRDEIINRLYPDTLTITTHPHTNTPVLLPIRHDTTGTN